MVLMFSKIRTAIGFVWSKATTISLGLLVAIVPALQAIDPDLLPSWAKLGIALLGVVVVVLRFVAPPPPAVRINTDDEVHVDRVEGTVTIVKNSEPIAKDVFSKTAGEKV